MVLPNGTPGGSPHSSPTRIRRFLRRRPGAVAVEMAIVLPIFLLILFAIIEFGRAMTVGQLLTTAARHGVRRAILEGSTNDDIVEFVKEYCQQTLSVDEGAVSVDISIEPGPSSPAPQIGRLSDAKRGDLCTVEVQVPFDEVSYFPASFLVGKRLSANCTMEHE